MTLHRFFLKPENFQGNEVTFPPAVSHQIRNVLRMQAGDKVIALNGAGREFEVRLRAIGESVAGTIIETRESLGEPRRRVVLYQGLLKGARLEMVLQKCTEIGVAEFVLVATARSVVAPPSASKMKRLEAIITEAAEQSGRGKLPVLTPSVSFGDALRRAAQEGAIVFPWEEVRGKASRIVGDLADGQTISLIIGPEGGFTAQEAEEARTAGAEIVSLGETVLRSETAAIVASTLLLLEMRTTV